MSHPAVVLALATGLRDDPYLDPCLIRQNDPAVSRPAADGSPFPNPNRTDLGFEAAYRYVSNRPYVALAAMTVATGVTGHAVEGAVLLGGMAVKGLGIKATSAAIIHAGVDALDHWAAHGGARHRPRTRSSWSRSLDRHQRYQGLDAVKAAEVRRHRSTSVLGAAVDRLGDSRVGRALQRGSESLGSTPLGQAVKNGYAWATRTKTNMIACAYGTSLGLAAMSDDPQGLMVKLSAIALGLAATNYYHEKLPRHHH